MPWRRIDGPGTWGTADEAEAAAGFPLGQRLERSGREVLTTENGQAWAAWQEEPAPAGHDGERPEIGLAEPNVDRRIQAGPTPTGQAPQAAAEDAAENGGR